MTDSSLVSDVRREADVRSHFCSDANGRQTADCGQLVDCVAGNDVVCVKRHRHTAVHPRQKQWTSKVVIDPRQHVEVVRDIRPPAWELNLVAPDKFKNLVRSTRNVLH